MQVNFRKHESVFRAKRRAILFDLDGTLYDGRPVRTQMAIGIMSAYYRRPAEAFRVFRGLQAYRRAHEQLRLVDTRGQDIKRLQLQVAADRCKMSTDALHQLVVRFMEEEPLPLLRRAMRPGLVPLLHLLKKANCALGVVSDYPALEKLRYMGIDSFFDVVVSAQDANVRSLKPSPSGLLAAVQVLDVLPQHTLYVGDRIGIDDVAARRAGMGSLIIAPHARAGSKPDGVPDYFELAAMVSELLSSKESSFEPAQ